MLCVLRSRDCGEQQNDNARRPEMKAGPSILVNPKTSNNPKPIVDIDRKEEQDR